MNSPTIVGGDMKPGEPTDSYAPKDSLWHLLCLEASFFLSMEASGGQLYTRGSHLKAIGTLMDGGFRRFKKVAENEGNQFVHITADMIGQDLDAEFIAEMTMPGKRLVVLFDPDVVRTLGEGWLRKMLKRGVMELVSRPKEEG